jgi:hypothetical protein
MSLRLTALIYMACFAALSMGLYLVKYTVQDMQREVAGLKDNLGQEKESLHLLKAEWAYLNRPDRLQHLADRHLDMVPIDSRQIEDIAVLPAAASGDDDAMSHSMAQPIAHVVVSR